MDQKKSKKSLWVKKAKFFCQKKEIFQLFLALNLTLTLAFDASEIESNPALIDEMVENTTTTTFESFSPTMEPLSYPAYTTSK